jgi:hypothetical protein
MSQAAVIAFVPGLVVETPVERRIARDPEIRAGWAWGCPRSGHPEGRVGLHVADMLRRIGERGPMRRRLRLAALVHDSFKFRVRPDRPYSADNDHAVLARRYAEGVTDDDDLLDVIELHDAPFWVWRTKGPSASQALSRVIARVADAALLMRFVELDAGSEGKDPAPTLWLRDELRARGRLP